MNVDTLDDLAHAHRPEQFELLEHMIGLFSASEAVSHLLVRGSLASGKVDRLSDVDLVIGVADTHLPALVTVHDALLQVEFGSVLPAWRDRIVGDMGGVGFVHLVPWDGRLQQIDLYFVPTSGIEQVRTRTRARAVLARPVDRFWPTTPPMPEPRYGATELLVEVLVIGFMIRKRIRRDQDFIAYGEANMLATAAKDLVKVALAPDSCHYGWYRLNEEVGVTPIGQACLRDLREVLAGPAVPTTESLDRSLALVLAIARRAAPEAVETLQPALDTYWNHLEEL